MKIIGQCSLCKGPVSFPDGWLGSIPPTPACQSCGAVQKLPVIEMEKPPVKKERPKNVYRGVRGK